MSESQKPHNAEWVLACEDYYQGHDFQRRVKVSLFVSRVVTWAALAWMVLAIHLHMPILIIDAASVSLLFFFSTQLIKRQHFTLARTLLMSNEVLAITIAMYAIGPEGRLDLALLISFSTPFIVFSWKFERGYIIFFAITSVCSWLLAWYTQVNLFGYHEVSASTARAYFAPTTMITLFGVMTAMFIYFTNVTQKIETELENARCLADQANHAKSQFLANMSHELRTPMHAIMGMSELALKYAEQPKQIDYLNKVSQASNKLMQIIDNVLDFSTLEDKQIDLKEVPFRLHELLQQFVDTVKEKADNKEIALDYQFHTALPTDVTGDPQRIKQILTQLADNAVKFTPRGGTISFQVIPEHHNAVDVSLTFTIKDNGIGIDEQHKDRLFEPFCQQDESSTREFGGTGLGLALSRQLVEMMGGRIWVDSEPGLGSTFHTRIPLSKLASPA